MTSPLAQRAELQNVREIRYRPFSGCELRDVPDGTGGTTALFTGYASIFSVPYSVTDWLGEYTETVQRSAFDRTLADGADVAFLVNHEGAPLARTKSGTMRLSTDETGLLVEARLDPENNATARALRSAVQRGDIDQMSFSFKAMRQTWDADYLNRSLQEVSIHQGDVSAVNQGANGATAGTLAMRAYLQEVRGKYSQQQIEALGKAGKAFKNPDGHYSYPCADREDVQNAVHAIGRGNASHTAIRRFIIKRADALGCSSLIPDSWNSDGTLKGAAGAGRLGEHRAPIGRRTLSAHVPPNCDCCTACPGILCNGLCCDSCAEIASAAAAAQAGIAGDSMDQPSAESLGLPNFDIEARLMILQHSAGLPLRRRERFAADLREAGRLADEIMRRRGIHR